MNTIEKLYFFILMAMVPTAIIFLAENKSTIDAGIKNIVASWL